jgi:hypothetical protein
MRDSGAEDDAVKNPSTAQGPQTSPGNGGADLAFGELPSPRASVSPERARALRKVLDQMARTRREVEAEAGTMGTV